MAATQSMPEALMDRAMTLALLLPPAGREEPRVSPPERREDEIERGLPEEYEAVGFKLRDKVIMPAVRSGAGFGRVTAMDTVRLIPHYKYAPRFELLTVMARGFRACRRAFRRTAYYRDQSRRHGAWAAALKVARYYRLLESARREGLKMDVLTRRNLPVVFCARDIVFRLDGTHRCSVARFLGHDRLPIVAVTPRDVLALPGLPPDVADFVKSLAPPDPDVFAAG